MKRIAPSLPGALPGVFLAALLAGAAAAQQAGPYAECLALAGDAETADQAVAAAIDWEDRGGGAQARHCAAIAFLRLGYEAEAAGALAALTEEQAFADPAMQAELLRQSAAAWLLAGNAAQAAETAAAGLAILPDDRDLALLRARARMEGQDYSGAEADLTAMMAGRPDDPEALTLRAQSRLAQNALGSALFDAERAVAAAPDDIDARLVLGDVREAMRRGEAP